MYLLPFVRLLSKLGITLQTLMSAIVGTLLLLVCWAAPDLMHVLFCIIVCASSSHMHISVDEHSLLLVSFRLCILIDFTCNRVLWMVRVSVATS